MLSHAYSCGISAIGRFSPITRISAIGSFSLIARMHSIGVQRCFSSDHHGHDDKHLWDHSIPSLGDKARDITHRVTAIETDVRKIETDMRKLQTQMQELRTDMKLGFSQLEMKFAQFGSEQQRIFAQFGLDQQKTFAQFYIRTLFAVIGVSALLIGSTLIASQTEATRLDNEIKRRAIINAGIHKMTEDMAQKGKNMAQQ